MRERAAIKDDARRLLSANRWRAVATNLVIMLIPMISVGPGMLWMIFPNVGGRAGGASFLIYVLTILVMPALLVSGARYFTDFWRGTAHPVSRIFELLTEGFVRKLLGYLWMMLWVFLWSMLFIIPGLIKGLEYAAVRYILANHPNVAPRDALKLSMRVTAGHRLDILVFYLSFLGWELVSSFTMGILDIVHVAPYRSIAEAGFFLEMMEEALADSRVSQDELSGMVSA